VTKRPADDDQVEVFRKAARALGADETEAAFDTALSKIARHKPKPDKAELDRLMGKVARRVGNKDD
jgi:hypothetical protein